MKRIITTMLCLFASVISVQAQRGANNDWVTENADPQRTATVKADAKINKDSVAKPGAVKFLWKLKLKNAPRQLNNLTPPATLERLIGYRGFRMLGFVAGSDDNLFTIDTDLGRMEWEKHLNAAPSAQASTLACPGGMTTGVVRPTVSAIAAGGGGGFGPGRNTPAKSTVGEPWAGATTLTEVRPQPNFPGPPPGAAGGPGGQGANRPGGQGANRPGAPPMGGGFGGSPNLIYALASDGALHSMHLSGGQEYQPPVKFLPPGANANGLIIVNGKAYAVTSQSCNGVANGLWAYDFEAQQASTWKGNVVGTAGAAFGGDGTIYVATGVGEGAANSVVAIDPKTLQTKSAYKADSEFASSPVVFEYKGKTLAAAAAADGSLHLVDAASMTALSVTPATAKAAAPGSLASWQDRDGARWILVAHTGALPAGFKSAGGAVTKGAILAWKLGEEDGKPALKPGWASRDLASPLTPTVINGVVLATSSGEFRANDGKTTAAMRAARSGRAVIYLLDGATGKELWSSGATITSFARGNALSGGMGQFYLTTYDGTIYAFGFPMEH
jgi:hypothetical protein